MGSGALLPLLVALLAAQGDSAPLQPGGSPAITKIYPRGSHWAVGHLMGKKSAVDFFPSPAEEGGDGSLPASPENIEQLDDISKPSLLRGNENRSTRFWKGHPRNSWARGVDDSWKDVMDSLLRSAAVQASAPS